MPSEEDQVAAYLAELRQLPQLSPTEERDSLKRVSGRRPVVALLALRLTPDWMRPLDAIHEANLVLLRLIEDAFVDRPAERLTDALVAHLDEVTRRLGK